MLLSCVTFSFFLLLYKAVFYVITVCGIVTLIPRYTTPLHIIPHYSISHHTTPYHITLHHITSHHITPYLTTSSHNSHIPHSPPQYHTTAQHILTPQRIKRHLITVDHRSSVRIPWHTLYARKRKWDDKCGMYHIKKIL